MESLMQDILTRGRQLKERGVGKYALKIVDVRAKMVNGEGQLLVDLNDDTNEFLNTTQFFRVDVNLKKFLDQIATVADPEDTETWKGITVEVEITELTNAEGSSKNFPNIKKVLE